MLRLLASLMLIAGALGPAAATDLTADDRAWIAACVAQLAGEPAPNAEVKQRYCLCMHEQFDDNRPVTQTEMERLYPPMHRACNRESGWK